MKEKTPRVRGSSPGRQKRRRYLPPRITYTEISPREALMGICKGGLGAGPFGPGCAGPCLGGGS